MARRDERSAEDRLIARLFAPLASAKGALALTDDAAFLTPPRGCDVVLTTDALIEGVHFFGNERPETLARKALRVNLSDLAAKGARPLGFLLSLGIPARTPDNWLRGFARGLRGDIGRYRCALFGGDTVRSQKIVINVAMLGAVPRGHMVQRKGAKAGDCIFVSGTIGDGALGLLARRGRIKGLHAGHRRALVNRYEAPSPRVALAPAVLRFATAAMDVSDGLIGDLAKLCRVSRVGAEIDAGRVPLSAAARAAVGRLPGLLRRALTGGADYEILCTVAPGRAAAFRAAARRAGVPVAMIGTIKMGGEVEVRYAGCALHIGRGSFSHF